MCHDSIIFEKLNIWLVYIIEESWEVIRSIGRLQTVPTAPVSTVTTSGDGEKRTLISGMI